MNDLKPCPFCGEDDVKRSRHMTRDEPENWDYYTVSCRTPECGASVSDLSEKGVTSIWNRRDGVSDP